MKKQSDPVGPDNDDWLKLIASKAAMIICCWGNDGGHMQRDLEVLHEILRGYKLHCLKVNDDGSPQHPLYISKLTEPIEYRAMEPAHPRAERDEGIPSPTKKTTHKLEIGPENVADRRWRCKCGYTLGDGRDKFLAPCPAARTE